MKQLLANLTDTNLQTQNISNPQSFIVSSANFSDNICPQNLRADVFLAKQLNCSRAKIQQFITKQCFLCNGTPLTKFGTLLKKDDKITFNPPQTLQNTTLQGISSLEIPILYEDADLLILNKPHNLIVHRTNEEDTQITLVDWLQSKHFSLSHLGDSSRRGIVHRLDKGTSGAIVIAKNNLAHELLSAQLRDRTMSRYYLCVINQALKNPKIVDLPLMRHPKKRLKYLCTTPTNPNAKPSKSAFFNIATNKDSALIGAKLFSGRTHQIRVHLHAINRHILGDFFYGYRGSYQGRILLHAHLIQLKHPSSQETLRIYAPMPQEMQDFLKDSFCLERFDSEDGIVIPLDELYCKNFYENSLDTE